MRSYSNKISLTKNSRGIYSLDSSIGCKSGIDNNKGGCYNDCYAAKSAKLYGYDFGVTVFRHFENEAHKRKIINQIGKIKLDFVRIGTSGDPSEDWEHTLSVCDVISRCNKEIVIITKHWTNLTNDQLQRLSKMNVCINTSVSALDKTHLIENSVLQYQRIKLYCKSILRIVSADFNLENETGRELNEVQKSLFKNPDTIDTVLRVGKNNQLVRDGIIKIKEATFLGKKTHVSKYNRKTYFGKCENCHEMCGVRIDTNLNYPMKKGIVKQTRLFK